jgi:hypothetical protein
MPQTIFPYGAGVVVAGLDFVPTTLLSEMCALGGAWLTWTVRATAKVAISATATAERNFAVRDIIECLAGFVLRAGDNEIFALHKIEGTHIKLFNDVNEF